MEIACFAAVSKLTTGCYRIHKDAVVLLETKQRHLGSEAVESVSLRPVSGTES